SGLRAAMYKTASPLARIGARIAAANDGADTLARRAGETIPHRDLASPVADFYLTNPIARSSKIMAELSAMKTATPAREAAE
ncbi:MAG: NADH-quinone oxidoreductase subunit G, partial [Pseudomonadota bacterium]